MRSRSYGFAFLFGLFAFVLAAFISLSACTASQKAAATNAVNATTHPTQDLATGAGAAAVVAPPPLNTILASIAAAASLAIAVEKALSTYIIPNLPTKADPTSTANPSVASAVPKPQVLPS